MDIPLKQIAQLIAIAERADIDELEVNQDDLCIRITCRHPHHQPAMASQVTHAHPSLGSMRMSDEPKTAKTSQPDLPTNQPDLANTTAITSPMVGTFYSRSSPENPSFVAVGQTVAVNDTLCIVEAMKIMHEVKAEQAGVIEQIFVKDGDMVEYGQHLFNIRPSA